MTALRFRYEGGATPGRVREVTPFGLLFGRSNYLVADEGAGPRNWRLDRIFDVAVTDRAATRAAAFSLQDYADQSFGIFHDDTEDVVLQVTPAGREDALRWRFHANQQVEPQADGSVIVRFRASGMLELAWHLFTWGDKVRVVAPDLLRQTLLTQLELVRRAHTTGSVAPGA
jgi:predicted DNA-binding transcriptional regulator YafY